MHLAIINESTRIVENIIAPPKGATAWIVPAGYVAVETEYGAIGDTWDGGDFLKPDPEE